MIQKTLDDAIKERDEAMERADQNAKEAWRIAALDTVYRIATMRAELWADLLWQDGLETPREPRALGPILVAAQKRGWIEPTDRVVPSVRRHATIMRVWRSCIYGGKC